MSTVKRWIITGASFGAGLAIVLALIVGGYLWYETRPKPPKPWDTKAITATYDLIDTTGDENFFTFYYTLQNNTDYDYHITEASNVALMAKLEKQQSLSGGKATKFLEFDSPIFLPAKQRLRFMIELKYPYNQKGKADATKDEREQYRKELSAYLKERYPNLNGFVLFDEYQRYQIDFPAGW